MVTSRRRGKNYRQAISSIMRRMLEALEPRVLLSGNSYTIGVYSFTGGADGAAPYAGLVADTHGNLFGATTSGGSNSLGTLFELPAGSGTATAFHGFTGTPDGATPFGGLAIDQYGNLFGTTYAGGAFGDGTVFEISAGSSIPTILYSFSGLDGANPYAGVVVDTAGDIFGTTVNGGLLGSGTVFEIPHGGAFTTLHSFTGFSDGGAPYAPLLRDGSGNLFGTTFSGGSGKNGTVFEISGGTFTTLFNFTGAANGAKPTGQLLLTGTGNIVGTTYSGGANGDGTIFSFPATGGALTSLYSFTGGIDGSSPYSGLVLDNAGDLLGTTYRGGAYGKGTVFEIPAAAAAPQTLYSFTGGADGRNPYGPVFVNANGDVFGTTTAGGAAGFGTLFELAPTATTQIAVAQQPSDVQAGNAMTPSITVNLELANNDVNVADNSSVTLSIISGPSGATLSGTSTVQASLGVATFGNLRLTRAGTYTLAVSDGTLASVTLDSFVVHAGPAARLAFDQQPTGFIAGQTMAPAPSVYVEDALGNVTTDNSMVTLKIASGPTGAAFTGTLTVQAAAGLATFNGLSLTKAGSYTVSASDGNFPTVKSASFVVTPDLASAQFIIARQPGNTIVAKKISPGVLVDVEDQYGNLITTSTAQVTASLVVVSLAGNATAAALTGTTTVNVVKGVASLGNLAISQPGTYELQLTGGGLAPVTTNSLLSYFVPTHLVFTQQPTLTVAGDTLAPAIMVAIEDSAKRIDTTNDSLVTITLKGNGTLNGTLSVAAVDGVATFSNLMLTQAGTYTLSAASGVLTGAKSATFHVVPDVSTSQLVVGRLPVNTNVVGKTLAPNLVVDVVDQYGNVITTDRSAATISIASGPTAGTIIGATTINASGGVLTFKNLTLPVAGAYSLQVADASLANATPVFVAQTITQGVTSVSGLPAAASRIFGQTITLTANFKSTAPGAIPFTGTATLTDSSADVLGAVALTAGGQAKFSLTGVAPGAYLCTVSYPGDVNHTPVTSSTFTLQVNLAGTSTALAASSNTLVFGQPLTLTATVKSSNAPNVVRTGSVHFYDGLTPLGTEPLNGSSIASITFTPSTVGSHAYTAVYVGDGNFQPSTSSVLGRTVHKDQTAIALTPTAASPIPHNQTFSLNVQVTVLAPGASTLTGNLVTIKDNGKVLGTVNLDSSGDASLPGLSYSAAGMHSLTAIYAGDADTLTATSLALKLTID